MSFKILQVKKGNLFSIIEVLRDRGYSNKTTEGESILMSEVEFVLIKGDGYELVGKNAVSAEELDDWVTPLEELEDLKVSPVSTPAETFLDFNAIVRDATRPNHEEMFKIVMVAEEGIKKKIELAPFATSWSYCDESMPMLEPESYKKRNYIQDNFKTMLLVNAEKIRGTSYLVFTLNSGDITP